MWKQRFLLYLPHSDWFHPREKGNNSSLKIVWIPSELPAFILGFDCRVSEPPGHAQVTNLKQCSNLHQIRGLVLVLGLEKLLFPDCVHSFKEEEITLEMGLC